MYFVERIGADRAEVFCPLPPDADPAHWQPTGLQIEAIQAADLVVLNGANFESWPERVSVAPSRIVRMSRPLTGRLLRYENAVTHSHGEAGKHVHGGVDGHAWMDPRNAREQAAEVLARLIRLRPEHESFYRKNFEGLAADLDGLDRRLRRITARLRGRALIANHPAYNYIARRYGWKLHNLNLDPKKDMDAADEQAVKDILELYDADPARRPGIVLWESEPTPATRARLTGRFKIAAVVFGPLEWPDAAARGLGYIRLWEANLDRLEQAAQGP